VARITISQIPAAVDLLLYQGDDFFLDIHAANTDGSDFDLTGWTPKAQFRVTPPDDTVMAELSCTAAASVVSVHLTHDASTALVFDRYTWDVQVTRDSDGVVQTLCYGNVTMTDEVTR
jgi:hypothetical protein